MIFGLDRHYYPVIVPTGCQLHIGGAAVALTAGTYWTHDNPTTIDGCPSFWAHLILRLVAVLGGSWSVAAHQPAGYAVRSGVRLIREATTATTVDWNQTTGIIKELLGWPATQAGTTALAALGSTRILDSPRAAVGSWMPWSLYDGRAEGKDSARERVTDHSSEHPEVAQAVVWRQRKLRVLSYPLVFGAHVLTGRASVAAVAEQAHVGLGDDHNTVERLWASAGLDLKDVLVVHDLVIPDLQITTHSYERARLASRAAAERLEVIATRSPIAADLWQVRIPYVITGGNYGL